MLTSSASFLQIYAKKYASFCKLCSFSAKNAEIMLLLFTKPFVKIPLKRSNKKANGKQFILKTLQVHNSFCIHWLSLPCKILAESLRVSARKSSRLLPVGAQVPRH